MKNNNYKKVYCSRPRRIHEYNKDDFWFKFLISYKLLNSIDIHEHGTQRKDVN